MTERVKTIEQMHRRYAGVLYDKCVRMLGDRSEAEDAVQETFVNAFRGLDSFTYGDSHLPWLYRIATNVCLKIIRTRRRKGVAMIGDLEQVAEEGPENIARSLHMRRTLEQLVDRLDERNLAIVIAHYVDGMDQGQVADQLGISRRAVVKRLTALRKQLHHLFNDQEGL